MKFCKYCEKYFPETDFGVAKTTPNKVYRRCKCRYCYRKTKNDLKEKRRGWINAYKEDRGCFKCGIRDYRVLDFHHKDESIKSFGISEYYYHQYDEQKLKNEILKCDVMCANCHRILHAENLKRL